MTQASHAPYEHRQAATWVLAALCAGAALSAALGFLAGGGEPARLVGTGVALVLLVLAWLFNGLRVRVTDDRIAVAFGPGWIARRFPLSDVADVRAVRNRWWYGWGIRLTPHGWLFNIAGLDAVELTFRSGKRFRIGTDEPEALVQAIRTRLR